MLNATTRCHQGKVRSRNEDSVLSSPELGLWAVADGVGGNGHGDVASELAMQALERKVRQGLDLRSAVSEADAALKQAVAQQEDLKGMATTVVACKVEGDHFEVCWVGDSRAYLLDASGLHRLTQDHNVAGELLASGDISAEEFQHHPGQRELTKAIGLLQTRNVPRSVGEFHEGDRLLLCTDGLSGVVEERQIEASLSSHEDLDACADHLLALALEAGAPDNIALALLHWQPEPMLVNAKDFKPQGFRLPFDRRPYDEHCKQRPWLLMIILVALVVTIFLI